MKTKTINPIDIGYSIYLEKLEPLEGYTLLNDNEVKIYLTDHQDQPLVPPTLVSDLDNYVIYKKFHTHDETNNEVIGKYKLKMWVDKDVTGEGWDKNTKLQYSFKIGVNALENTTYRVIFDSNNGSGDQKTQYIGKNESVALEKNQFTKKIINLWAGQKQVMDK